MAGLGSMGKWEASSVTDNNIRELKHAVYLSANIAHHAPEANQVVPTPKPGGRVVYVPHFIWGLGFLLEICPRGNHVMILFPMYS